MERPFQLPDKYYPFKTSGGSQTSYSFLTVNDVEYQVVFKPTANILGNDQPYSHLLYEFSMLAKFAGPQSYVRDDLIGATVAAIFLNFYNQHDQNVCFYVCDFSDEKQHVRSRKFNDWYMEANRGAFIKLDVLFKGYDDVTVPASMVIAKDNQVQKRNNNVFPQLAYRIR